MQNIVKQRGISMTGLSALMVVIGIFALVAIKLIPIYMENAQIVSVMERLVEKSQSDEMSLSDVRKGLVKRFSLENIRDVDPEDMVIQQTSDGLALSIEYEVRTSLFGNVELLVVFDNQAGATVDE